jgi:hypothetical protein
VRIARIEVERATIRRLRLVELSTVTLEHETSNFEQIRILGSNGQCSLERHTGRRPVAGLKQVDHQASQGFDIAWIREVQQWITPQEGDRGARTDAGRRCGRELCRREGAQR